LERYGNLWVSRRCPGGLDAQAAAGAVAAMVSTRTSWLASGLPRQLKVMWENSRHLDLVPYTRALDPC
jgi:hypothetical protein